MKKEPRYYQQDAVNALIDGMEKPHCIPYANMACGTGKAMTLAVLSNHYMDQGERVLQLVPSMELCRQNYLELVDYLGYKHKTGIVCAGLNKKEYRAVSVIATVNSFLPLRNCSGTFEVLMIDECDLINPNHKSMYQKIIDSLTSINPLLKICGVTGSPYRMGIGSLEVDSEKYGKATFTDRVYCTDLILPRLIKEGYLSDMKSISGEIQADMSTVRLNNLGEYDTSLMAVKFDAIVSHAVPDFINKIKAYDIKTALVFASSIANAEHIIKEYKLITGINNIRLVHGGMAKTTRENALKWFSDEDNGTRLIVNVGVLTRGYNYPLLDCVILMRATNSLSLYVQSVSRAIRHHNEKECGYVIDYGGNIERHGAIDDIKPLKQGEAKEAPKKECKAVIDVFGGVKKEIKGELYELKYGEQCHYPNLISAKKCLLCDAHFIIDESSIGGYSMRTYAEILKLKEKKHDVTHKIGNVYFEMKYNANNIAMIVVNLCNESGHNIHKHYLCLDHGGYAKEQALGLLRTWFKSKDDFNELYNEYKGISSELAHSLLDDDNLFDRYFKKIDCVTIAPQKDNPKFKTVTEWVFCNGNN